MPAVEKTLQLADGEVHVRLSAGSGWPILLLHGSGASGHVFRPVFESSLADRFQLIAPDLPGHGRSADAVDARAAYGILGFSRTVLAILDRLEVPRAIVYGWSLGGHVAIQMLHEAPERVAGLMISGAPPVPAGPLGMLRGFHASWDMLLASKQNFSARDVDRFMRLCFGTDGTPELHEMISRADGRARVEFVRSMMRGDGADQKRALEIAEIPIALVNGADEPVIRLSYLAGLAIPHLWEGRSHLIPSAGHSPFWQTPGQFNELLGRFADAVVEHEHLLATRPPILRQARSA